MYPVIDRRMTVRCTTDNTPSSFQLSQLEKTRADDDVKDKHYFVGKCTVKLVPLGTSPQGADKFTTPHLLIENGETSEIFVVLPFVERNLQRVGNTTGSTTWSGITPGLLRKKKTHFIPVLFLTVSSIEEAEKTIQETLVQFRNPKHSATTCTAGNQPRGTMRCRPRLGGASGRLAPEALAKWSPNLAGLEINLLSQWQISRGKCHLYRGIFFTFFPRFMKTNSCCFFPWLGRAYFDRIWSTSWNFRGCRCGLLWNRRLGRLLIISCTFTAFFSQISTCFLF